MGALESFVLPAVAGVSFSAIAVAYRLGQPRQIAPLDLLGGLRGGGGSGLRDAVRQGRRAG